MYRSRCPGHVSSNGALAEGFRAADVWWMRKWTLAARHHAPLPRIFNEPLALHSPIGRPSSPPLADTSGNGEYFEV